jgi:hypothetical protein
MHVGISSALDARKPLKMRTPNENNVLPRTLEQPSYPSLDPIRRQRYPWKKIAVVAGVVVAFIWLLTPRGRALGGGYMGGSASLIPSICLFALISPLDMGLL